MSTKNYTVQAGGKGANQAVALCKAGLNTYHAGKIGGDGVWISELMSTAGVDVTYLTVDETQRTGCAVVQVCETKTGEENAILIFDGANQEINDEDIRQTLSGFSSADVLVMQNEISNGHRLLKLAKERGMFCVFSPAPLYERIIDEFDFDCADVLVMNEVEAATLHAQIFPEQGESRDYERILKRFSETWPNVQVILITLGSQGVLSLYHGKLIHIPSRVVEVVDAVGAGDTFMGFFLGHFLQGEPGDDAELRFRRSVRRGCLAASISVTSLGAMNSIPSSEEVDRLEAALYHGLV